MADGTPRLVLDLQCTLAEIAALGLIPGTPFGIARITGEASMTIPASEMTLETRSFGKEETAAVGPLCRLACQWCKDPEFWQFLRDGGSDCDSEEKAKAEVIYNCGITSRRHLDTNEAAATIFHEYYREAFIAWKAA